MIELRERLEEVEEMEEKQRNLSLDSGNEQSKQEI